MTPTPRISVVIPTYNSAQYLPETVASVLSQTFSDLEILVIDDGSTDTTAAAVRRWPFPVTYIPLAHTGIPAIARNRGIAVAKGDVIAFLDSDDLWHRDKLACQLALLDREPTIDACFTDFTYFGAISDSRTAFDRVRRQIQAVPQRHVAAAMSVITSPSFLTDMLRHGPIPFWTSTVLVRRRCFDTLGPFNEEMPLDDDTQMWFRLAQRATVGLIDRPLAKRRVRASSITATIRQSEASRCSIRTLETLDQWLTLTAPERLAVTERLAALRFGAGYHEFSLGNLRCARQYFRASLRAQLSVKATLYLLLASLPLAVSNRLREGRRWLISRSRTVRV